ncbi:11S globulin seed storage protein Ana o 2.0101-like [Euphorbia lathyris]|uniref:11S globulin seed storage protein Ana o 2.0101-like n=1 Tax=Euphorbia lathyris TaxID=212925 RepID=UPI003313BFE6
MAYFSMLSISLCSLLLLHGCIVISSNTNCQEIHRLVATEPDIHMPSEAGSIDIWNPNTDQFQCAGVQVVRYTIQPNGHALPFYTNAYKVSYIIQGSGILGVIIPGCSQELNSEKNECEHILHFQSGDVFALRPGETLWSYNSGCEPIIVIAIYRITHTDPLRRFVLGGPQNILDGFSLKFIVKAFNIDNELATKLQSKIDLRGIIIYLTDGLHLSNSTTTKQCSRYDQQEQKGFYNAKDEFFCNINTRITKISEGADLYIPQVGHLTTMDAHEFPILESIQLSLSYNLLLKDVMRLPHWDNNDNIIYVVKGEGHIQVVDDNGKNVFDDMVKEGQVLLVPHSFLMVEQSNSERFEYVTFKTNANPITSDLSGRKSVINCLPLEVLTNAFKITQDEAKKVKFGRKETSLAKSVRN